MYQVFAKIRSDGKKPKPSEGMYAGQHCWLLTFGKIATESHIITFIVFAYIRAT